MWKIAKAELSYLKPLILFSYTIFLALSFASSYLVRTSRYPPAGVDYFIYMILWIMAVHLIVIIVSLYLEMNEKRLASVAVIPIRSVHVSYARVLVPVLTVLLHILLAAACGLVLLALYPSGASEPFPNQQHTEDFLSLSVSLLSLWLISTYAVRLLSEWQGRILFLSFFVLLLVYNLSIPAVKPGLAQLIDRYILYLFSPPHGLFLKVLVPVALCFLIHIFFMRRRSYLG